MTTVNAAVTCTGTQACVYCAGVGVVGVVGVVCLLVLGCITSNGDTRCSVLVALLSMAQVGFALPSSEISSHIVLAGLEFTMSLRVALHF